MLCEFRSNREKKVPFRLFNYPLLNNQLIHPLQPPQYPLPQIHNIRKPFQLQQRLFQIHPQQGHPLKFIEERTEGCKEKSTSFSGPYCSPWVGVPNSFVEQFSHFKKGRILLFLWLSFCQLQWVSSLSSQQKYSSLAKDVIVANKK